MIDESNRAKIDRWIADAPDFRIVESNPTHHGWESVAREGGEIVYEELDVGTEEPLLDLMAAWCERLGPSSRAGRTDNAGEAAKQLTHPRADRRN